MNLDELRGEVDLIDTEITGVIHHGEKASDEFTYTVQDYLTEAQTTMADDAKFMALAGSLATYGYYANELFAFDPDFTQHALFDDSGFASVAAASLADNAAQINDTADGVTYVGSSLVLRTETAIKHYFTLPPARRSMTSPSCWARATPQLRLRQRPTATSSMSKFRISNPAISARLTP